MSQQGVIHRQSRIIEYLMGKANLTFQNIWDKLKADGHEITERTLQRDIEVLRHEYGLVIDCEKPNNFYKLDLAKSKNYEYILHFIDIAISADLMISSLKDGIDAREYLAFDSENSFKGAEHLKTILLAIKESKCVQFCHTSFQSGNTHNATVSPYLLKEYQGRWYLVGENMKLKEFRTYGLDRISDLESTSQKFKRKLAFNADEYFGNLIGISHYTLDEQPLQEIILSFEPKQGLYFKSLPWCPYEEKDVLIDNESEFRISLYLLPNYELQQRLLMHSDTITVIKPQWLINKIYDIQKECLRKYNKGEK